MENYGTKNNEDDDDILDGKKSKKAERDGWHGASESQEEAKAEARKSLLDLFAEVEKGAGSEVVLFPQSPKEEKPKSTTEQPGGEVTAPVEQIEVPMPQPVSGVESQEPEAASTDVPNSPKAASRLEDLFKQQPIFDQFRPQQQESEAVRPVSGYNREDNEYFQGYVPGVAQGNQSYEPPQTASGSNGGGNIPPRTPTRSGGMSPEPDGGQLDFTGVESKARPNFANTQSSELSSKHEDEVYSAESRGLRHGVVAGFLTGYILKSYLAGKRRKREAGEFQKQAHKQGEKIKHIQGEDLNKQKRISDQDRYIQRLQDEQQKIRRRFEERLAAVQPQVETRLKPTVFKPEKQNFRPEGVFVPMADLNNKSDTADDKKVDMVEVARKALDDAIDKEENKQRIEQDAWLRHVIDERGQEVQGIARGQEYKHERAQELLQRDHTQPQQQNTHKAAGQQAFTGTPTYPYQHTAAHPVHSQQALPSGQVPVDHQLSNGDRPSPYFSSKKNSNLVSTLTSPWTFLMLSLILLAYFIATLL